MRTDIRYFASVHTYDNRCDRIAIYGKNFDTYSSDIFFLIRELFKRATHMCPNRYLALVARALPTAHFARARAQVNRISTAWRSQVEGKIRRTCELTFVSAAICSGIPSLDADLPRWLPPVSALLTFVDSETSDIMRISATRDARRDYLNHRYKKR